jgi:hypothetical protein
MKIITANRLTDGIVVYLTGNGWVDGIGSAAVLNAPDAIEAGLASAKRAIANREVVDVAAIDVTLDDNRSPVPVKLRERIRAFGPTVGYGEVTVQRLVA